MLGQKTRAFKPLSHCCLDDLVPRDHFYRQLEAKLDLSFVRQLVSDRYCWWTGRPSIDPVVFFKLQLIMFFEGFRSERQLMEQVQVNLAFRWYIGYDLDEAIPDHSTLSKIRDRYGLEIFQGFFEHIVAQCAEAGLVWGQELHFDASLIQANASADAQVPRFYWQAIQDHLRHRFPAPPRAPGDLVEKYDGSHPVVVPNSYHKKSSDWIHPLDPQATPSGHDGQLGYRLHYVVDGGRARIIVGCLVTPSAIQDPTPMLDLAWWLRFRWHLPFRRAVADQRYGTIQNVVQLEQQGIQALIPLHSTAAQQRTTGKRFSLAMFTYDAQRDCYICPQGELLTYDKADYSEQRHNYKADAAVCAACPVRSQCTTGKHGRRVSHSFHKAELDRIAAYRETEAFRIAMRKRQVWIEPKFAEVKQWHQGRRFRLRGLDKVNGEALLKASVQNVKQLLKATPPYPVVPPSASIFSIIAGVWHATSLLLFQEWSSFSLARTQ